MHLTKKLIALLEGSAGERSEGAGREGPGGCPRGLSKGAGLEKSPTWSLLLRAVLPGT